MRTYRFLALSQGLTLEQIETLEQEAAQRVRKGLISETSWKDMW